MPAAWTEEERERYGELNRTYGLPASLTSTGGGMIGSTSGPLAIHAGLKVLQQGGSAADAAIATSLAQITLVAGSWSSFAGMLYAVYYDARSGDVSSLNAGFNTVLGETDPLTIPAAPTPSGRTAMTGGFMAGVEELHRRFGRLSFDELFEPAIYFAEEGFPIDSFIGKIIQARKDVLRRTPEGRAIFTKEDGKLYEEGDIFRQPELAETLRQIAANGADYMYAGPWGHRFVDTVQREGGRITIRDLALYHTEWNDPLATTYNGHKVHTISFPELGAVQLIEGLNLLELADLTGKDTQLTTKGRRDYTADNRSHYSEDPEALYRFIQLCRLGYAVTYSPSYVPYPGDVQPIPWISPMSRVSKETAQSYVERLQGRDWELKLYNELSAGSNHSDGIVVVDSSGNVAAVVHSINTSLWGSTGMFVEGVSIPDPASFQQKMIAKTGPGRRFPNIVNPVIVTRDGRPVLAACSIGNALHECMLQHLVNILDYGMDPQASLERPKFWGPMWGGSPQDYAIQAIDKGAFSEQCLAQLRELGQPLKELKEAERKKRVAYWVGIQIDPESAELRGAVSADFNGIFEADER